MKLLLSGYEVNQAVEAWLQRQGFAAGPDPVLEPDDEVTVEVELLPVSDDSHV